MMSLDHTCMTNAIETCWFPNAAKPLILCGSERSSCTPRCHRTSADVFLHSQSSSLAWFCTRTRRITYNFLFVLPKRIKRKITKDERRNKRLLQQEMHLTSTIATLGPCKATKPSPVTKEMADRPAIAPLPLRSSSSVLDSWPGFYFPRFAQRWTGDHPQEEWAK